MAMFRFTCKRISFSILLLTALLSGFCVAPVVELTGGEAPGSEIEELILTQREGEGLASTPLSYSFARICHKARLGIRRSVGHHCSENSARNGLGVPLVL